MQFKETKGRIQVLAYRGYDKEKRRAIVKTLGSLSRSDFSMSDGLREKLTDEERIELLSYIERKRQSDAAELRQSKAHGLYSEIGFVIDSLAIDKSCMSEDDAALLYSSIDDLLKAMRKAGFKRKRA